MLDWVLQSNLKRKLSKARVVKVIDHGVNVQLLCSDERGLLSVYLDRQPFILFSDLLRRAGMRMKGALIEFDLEIIQLALSDRNWRKQIKLHS
jgi:hypothetical protein